MTVNEVILCYLILILYINYNKVINKSIKNLTLHHLLKKIICNYIYFEVLTVMLPSISYFNGINIFPSFSRTQFLLI